jgi:hypothetical protein
MTRMVRAVLLPSILLFVSCIFQNNPLEPNQPPAIQSYTPELTFFSLTVPDSCVFSIRAADPDGDLLAYSFETEDSILSEADTVTFFAVRPGVFNIRGAAHDGTTKAYHDWHVTVVEKNNQPPIITWYYPDQKRVSCAVGDTLGFHFKASDENPAILQYSYLLNGATFQSGSPDLIARFMERGDFILEGLVWDGQYGDTVTWELSVTGFPDTIAPAAITDLTGGPGEVDGSLSLEWTAPGDDGTEGRAASYVVKTSVYPIVTEQDWVQADGKPGEPIPDPAGTRERMTIRNLGSANYVYVSMRAVDDFFNVSPIGNCSRALVRGIDIGGRALNGTTGEAVEGIVVTASSRTDTTDADGNYLLVNVPSYVTAVIARDENASGQLGNYFDCVHSIAAISQLVHMDFYMIPAFQLVNVEQPDVYSARFLMFLKEITKTDGYMGRSTVYKGWNHVPISVYNPPMTFAAPAGEPVDSIDMQAACARGLADWEQSTGIDLFTEAATAGEADVTVRYDTLLDIRHHVETPVLNPDGTPAKKVIWIYTKDMEVPYWRFADLIFTHELGHVVCLDHSRNSGHLMVGGTTPTAHHPTTDEIRVVQVLYHLPNIFDYSRIVEE